MRLRPFVYLFAVLALDACALFHRGEKAPTNQELASRYGCAAATVDENWQQHRMAAVSPGTPLCATIGRYGQPVSVHGQTVAGMQLLSLLHRPSDRYVDVTFVYYDDTKENRTLGRPVGKWIVQRYVVR